MTRSHLVTLGGLLLLTTASASGAPAGHLSAPTAATRAAPAAPAMATSSGCPMAGRAELNVPAGFDEVRVVVGGSRPGAAAAVTVLSGNSDRRLTAFGRGRWALTMTEPLPGGDVVVAVEPVLDAPASACVERVELVRGGAVIASARPR